MIAELMRMSETSNVTASAPSSLKCATSSQSTMPPRHDDGLGYLRSFGRGVLSADRGEQKKGESNPAIHDEQCPTQQSVCPLDWRVHLLFPSYSCCEHEPEIAVINMTGVSFNCY
jgi:hypothetical protein